MIIILLHAKYDRLLESCSAGWIGVQMETASIPIATKCLSDGATDCCCGGRWRMTRQKYSVLAFVQMIALGTCD